ncbi:hypothetical protein QVD17_36719 [Tagetes erecta]|uniref:Uncharacterized protein n=1 Tax=Tagetes erecta TaxID=13708 RepID=A0AAD8JSY1_TARER|nr:hypothetical protein QVD17_36719 [Tagetes erecta]
MKRTKSGCTVITAHVNDWIPWVHQIAIKFNNLRDNQINSPQKFEVLEVQIGHQSPLLVVGQNSESSPSNL